MPVAPSRDLKIARGLHYTGSGIESEAEGHEDLGSICSGGRYDSLAKDGKRTYPWVCPSVSRDVSRICRWRAPSRKVPTAVVVAGVNEERRARGDRAILRSRGISTDVAPSAPSRAIVAD